MCNWWNQELGGSIVNSVTIHRFPAEGDGFAHEDVAVFRSEHLSLGPRANASTDGPYESVITIRRLRFSP